jgi:large subunit ribosomal protein L32
MAVQQNKKSKSKKGMRRSHDRVAIPNVVYCSCGAPRLQHRVCPACGMYHNRQILTLKPDNEPE